MSSIIKLSSVVFLGAAVAWSLFFVGLFSLRAQENEEDTSVERVQLEEELRALEEEIARHRVNVEERRREAQTLERDVAVLNGEIRGIGLHIQAVAVALQVADAELDEIRARIVEINEAIDRQREQIAALLRRLNENDSTSLLEMLLADETLADFFTAVDSLQILQGALHESLEEVRQLRAELEDRQVRLEERVEEQGQLLAIQEIQRGEVSSKRSEVQHLLDETRGEEELFQEILTRTEQSAAQIRGRLFILDGGDAGGPLTFEQAYELSKEAARATGLRVAFLMSIIKQESNFGANVGRCYLRDPVAATGVHAVTGDPVIRVMKASRDVAPFLQITQSLGRDPFNTPVSCWPGIYYQGVPFGFGGGMGPAQFIASTWMGYAEDVAELLAKSYADPWLPLDAFTASALKLSRAGANSQTYNGEWCAAMIYYSGSCTRNVGVNRFYADSVMRRAAQYERDIAILEGGN